MTAVDLRRDTVFLAFRSWRGITLVEMVVSLTITSIILGACGSIVLLASRVIGISAAGPAVSTAAADAAASQVAADLKVALAITERTATAVTFTVPDRNGDSLPETLRYAWAGPGSPLTRQYNGQPVPAASIADNVQDFSITYFERTTGLPPLPPPIELPEQVLICHEDAPGGSFGDHNIKDRYLGAAYFVPSLPANAISWKITRVKFMAKHSGGATGPLTAEVRDATSSCKPGTTILESATFAVETLSNEYTWVEMSCVALSDLTPSVGLCLVITSTKSSVVGTIQYESGGSPMTENTHWMTTTNGGVVWSTPDDLKDMCFYVYGTVTIQP